MPRPDYIEFQDRSVAKGYLITFRCYGTWLHGDERGSMDRRYYHRYGGAKIKPDIETRSRKARLLKNQPFYLGAAERKIVDLAIREVCITRGYSLFALNVRMEHAHLVVDNSDLPERMMTSFKAYATKALRMADLVATDAKVWSRHGSTGYLWTEEHIAKAVDYVMIGQGGELPEFD